MPLARQNDDVPRARLLDRPLDSGRAVGFHALFDYAAMFLYGAPNSGNKGQPIPTKLLTGTFHGAPWLTGGPLGIEASWLAFPMIVLLFLGYHLATRRSAASANSLQYNPPHPV